jgi:hypothetical protein
MTGIHYVTDEKGQKVAVQIDLKKHKALWEDIQDILASQERRHEKSIPYQEYRANRSKRRLCFAKTCNGSEDIDFRRR